MTSVQKMEDKYSIILPSQQQVMADCSLLHTDYMLGC